MSQGKSAINSELWVDLEQGASDYNRSDVLSSALVRAVDAAGVQSLINNLKAEQQLNVDAQTEQSVLRRADGVGSAASVLGHIRRNHHGSR
jgi:hypothetical protein